jgi:hypothetical protein
MLEKIYPLGIIQLHRKKKLLILRTERQRIMAEIGGGPDIVTLPGDNARMVIEMKKQPTCNE